MDSHNGMPEHQLHILPIVRASMVYDVFSVSIAPYLKKIDNQPIHESWLWW